MFTSRVIQSNVMKRQTEIRRSSNNLRLLPIQVPDSAEPRREKTLKQEHSLHPQVHLHSMAKSGVVRDDELGTS